MRRLRRRTRGLASTSLPSTALGAGRAEKAPGYEDGVWVAVVVVVVVVVARQLQLPGGRRPWYEDGVWVAVVVVVDNGRVQAYHFAEAATARRPSWRVR